MTVEFVTSVANEANGTSFTTTISSPAAAGHYALAFFAYNTQTGLTIPSGWTLIDSVSTQSETLQVYGKVLTSGDIGVAQTWGATPGPAKFSVAIAVYSGVDTTTPIGGKATPVGYTTSGASRVSPSISGVVYRLICAAATKGSTPGSWTVPSGFTKRVEIVEAGGGALTTAVADSTTDLDGGDTWSVASAQAQAQLMSLWLNAGSVTPTAGTEVQKWVGAPTSTGFEVVSKVSGATSVRLAYSTDSGMASPSYVAAQTPNGSGRVKHVVTGLNPNTRYYVQLADTPSGGSETLIGSIGTIKTLQTKGVPFSGTRKVVVGGCIFTGADASRSLNNATAWGCDWGHFNGDFFYNGVETSVVSDHEGRWDTQLAAVPGLKAYIAAGVAARYNVSDHDCGLTDNGDSNNAWTAANILAYKNLVPYGSLKDPSGTVARDQQWDDGRVSYYMIDVRNTDRSPGANAQSSSKTMLGAAQLARLIDWLDNDPQPFKVIIGDTALMGSPDIVNKTDWWPSYDNERTTVAGRIAAAQARGQHVEYWHGDSHLVGYATSTKNTWWNCPVLCAAPHFNDGGGRNLSTFTAYFNNNSAAAEEYGRVTFTDDGTTITRTFSGWDAITDTEKVNNVEAFTPPAQPVNRGAFFAYL